MWVFLNNAFLSIVASDQDPSVFSVRARQRQDLVNAFPDCQVVPARRFDDYAWRAFIDRDEVEAMLVQRLRDVEYHNFKDSIARTPEGEERHDAYMAVWTAMKRFQDGWFRPFKRGKADKRRPHDDRGWRPD